MLLLMRADRGIVGRSERRCGIVMSGSDIAMLQRHKAASSRKLCICGSLAYPQDSLSPGGLAYMHVLHYHATLPTGSRAEPRRPWCGLEDHPRERNSLVTGRFRPQN
eukprot:6209405-Pleurochrysis_carterae.AAC.1